MSDPLDGTTCPSGPDGTIGPPGRPDPPARKTRGRPREVETPSGTISVWLSTRTQDHIIQLATRRRQSVSEYLRDVLDQLFAQRP